MRLSGTLLLIGVVLLALALTTCASVKRTSWELTAAPGDSDTTLQLRVYVGDCDDFERFDVKELEVDIEGQVIEAVTIKAYVHEGARDNCEAYIGRQERIVELSAPLGDRPLRGCNPPSSIYSQESDIPNDDCASSTLR